MSRTAKRNVVVSAILLIALCMSLIAGATFALFTSESKVNVAVTSGKVDVVATMDGLTLYSPTLISAEGEIIDAANAANNETKTFANGGTATVDENTITLTNITPGDKVTLNINVKNKSNVIVKYRTILACDADTGLFAGLKVTIDGEEYMGETRVSNYEMLAANTGDYTVPVTIELPTTAGNAYQDKTMKLSYTVEAVQGNTETNDPDGDIIYIYNANDLVALQSKTGVSKVEFLKDIDMTGYEWNGLKDRNFASTVIFFGNGKSISNLKAPLVGRTQKDVTVQGLTIKDSAEMNSWQEGDYIVNGAFVAYSDCADITLKSCSLKNVIMTDGTAKWGGGFVGFISGDASKLTLSACSVENCQISGKGSVGGFVGHDSASKTVINNCSAKGCILTAIDENFRVGSFVGTVQSNTSVTAPTSERNTLKMFDEEERPIADPGHELYGRIYAPGVITIDGAMPVNSVQGIADAINSGAIADLGGATLSEVGISDIDENVYIKNGTLEFGKSYTSAVGTFRSDTYFDIRPTTSDMTATFENVKFVNKINNTSLGPCTNRTEKVLQFFSESDDVETTIVFKGCEFINTYIEINGGAASVAPNINIIFEDCTFTNFGTEGAVWIHGNADGNVTFKDCEFDFTATGTQTAVNSNSSGSVTVNFEGSNTLVGAAAVESDDISVMNPSVKLISKYNNGDYTVTVNGLDNVTVSGIAEK